MVTLTEESLVLQIGGWAQDQPSSTGKIHLLKNLNHRLKVPNCNTIVQDRRRWKELVEKAKTLHKEL
jgi:hypothetical protein